MPDRKTLLRSFDRHWLKPVAFWLLALPGLWLAWQWFLLLGGEPNGLGHNPIETTHRFLGDTALRILLLSLAVTPVRDLTRWLPVMKIRRRIGLAAFWYALLHVLAYMGLDLYFAAGGSFAGMFSGLWEDVAKRIYITLGMIALVIFIPLALTSFDGVIRKLGTRIWQNLHYSVYPLAFIAVLHYGFMVKGNQIGPWLHGAVLAVLLAYRLVRAIRSRPASIAR